MSQTTYTVKQVAQILGYSTNSIYTFLKEKRIKGVRVGKGRFRIPQNELDRLLATTKSSKTTNENVGGQEQQIVPSMQDSTVIPMPLSMPLLDADMQMNVPTLFDWFVGLSAVIVGTSMFLFTNLVEEFGGVNLEMWLPLLRTSLIAGGLGAITSSFSGKRQGFWHNLFLSIIAIAYSVVAYVYGMGGDYEGGILYAFVSLSTAASIVLPVSVVYYCTVYFGLLLCIPIISLLTRSATSGVAAGILGSWIGTSWVWWFMGMAGIVLTLAVWSYHHSKRIFWMAMGYAAFMLSALSLVYASGMYWGRALLLLIAAYVGIMVPVWDTFSFAYKKDRKFVNGFFAIVGVIFIVTVMLARVMQKNAFDNAAYSLSDKLAYAKELMTGGLDVAQLTVAHGVETDSLRDALSAKKINSESITQILRVLYVPHRFIDRLAVVDAQGEFIAQYPREHVLPPTVGMSTYFTVPVSTKKQYVSPLSLWPGSAEQGYIISSPLIGGKDDVIGILISFVPVSSFGKSVTTLVNEDRGEYIVMVDNKSKRYIVHKDSVRLGQPADETDPAYLASTGMAGRAEQYDGNRTRILAAYAPLPWKELGISLVAPVSEVIKINRLDIITIYGFLVVSMVVLWLSISSRRGKVAIAANDT